MLIADRRLEAESHTSLGSQRLSARLSSSDDSVDTDSSALSSSNQYSSSHKGMPPEAVPLETSLCALFRLSFDDRGESARSSGSGEIDGMQLLDRFSV